LSLLRDIQDGATEDSVSLGSLLRKVKLLASRLGVKEIGEWTARELSGYVSIEELPSYRGPFEATVLGNAIGPYGSELRNFPIPRWLSAKSIATATFSNCTFCMG
jgi:hypothetical protein